MTSEVIAFVIDDDEQSRVAIQDVLCSDGFHCRTSSSVENFLAHVDLEEPGCVVVELRLSGMGGIELLEHLSKVGHSLEVILMSADPKVPMAVRGMMLGALDVLEKPLEWDVLLAAVQRGIKKSLEQRHNRVQVEKIRRRITQLSSRELETLRHVIAGKGNREIAQNLKLSVKTVANHRARLMAKTGALNAADLTRIAIQAGVDRHDP